MAYKEFFELGEVRQTDATEDKPAATYIKVTASAGQLKKLTTGSVIYTEPAKAKFERMLASPKLDDKAKEEVTDRMNRVPKWVLKRAFAKIPE